MHLVRLLLAAAFLVTFAQAANAQSSAGPLGTTSEWGPDDERGAANRITPQKVLEATQLIEEGRIYELGRVYESGMPLFPGRHYSLTIPGSPTGGPIGRNSLVLGHVGVRVDGKDIFYNGFERSEFGFSTGLTRLGVEKVGAFVTRGVLIDVAGYKKWRVTRRLSDCPLEP
jgi:hypothetical protein